MQYIRSNSQNLLRLSLDLGENLLRSALHDTTGNRQAGALLQEQINLTSGLATFVDTPEEIISIY